MIKIVHAANVVESGASRASAEFLAEEGTPGTKIGDILLGPSALLANPIPADDPANPEAAEMLVRC